jgi:hypothetical protein
LSRELFSFAVFRLVELAAGCGFVFACWCWTGGWLDEISTWLDNRSRMIDREP